jgi:hypothetical protein
LDLDGHAQRYDRLFAADHDNAGRFAPQITKKIVLKLPYKFAF